MNVPDIVTRRLGTAHIAPRISDSDLMEIRIPAGDFAGFDVVPTSVDWRFGSNRARYNPAIWLSKGYKGVRLIGAGLGLTNIVPDKGSTTSWDYTINVHPEAGHVVLEGVTLHPGPRAAAFIGRVQYAPPIVPFTFELRDCAVNTYRFDGTNRSAWGLFSYQSDIILTRCVFDCGELTEHSFYGHGFSNMGATVVSCEFKSSGAESLKFRNDPSETVATPGASVYVKDTEFKDWGKPWSNRGGGAGLVLQASGADIVVDCCKFFGGSGKDAMKCIAIDDNSGKGYYGAGTGALNTGAANGHVIIKDTGIFGIGPEWYENLVVIEPDGGGSTIPALSVWMEGCALYGPGSLFKVTNVPLEMINISYNNTQPLFTLASDAGVDVSAETQLAIAGGKFSPVSVGQRTQVKTV